MKKSIYLSKVELQFIICSIRALLNCKKIIGDFAEVPEKDCSDIEELVVWSANYKSLLSDARDYKNILAEEFGLILSWEQLHEFATFPLNTQIRISNAPK